jgi:cytochrome P450
MTVSASLSYDPYDPEIRRDPYPTYRRLREEAPLYYNEQYDFYALSRFDDCDRAVPDWETFPSNRGGILELVKSGMVFPPGVLIFEDPPIHDIHRSLLVRVFTPRRVAQLEPKIRAFCDACLDPLIGTDRFDLIAKLGAEMPMRVIGMLLGIPEDDQPTIRAQVDETLRTEAGKPLAHKDTSHLTNEIFYDYVDWRMSHPSDDLMTDLINAEFEDENGVTRTLTRDEIVTYVTVVSGAGNETTARLIGWLGTLLARHPDQRQDLVNDPSLIPNAVEETLRFEAPGPQLARYVARDVEFYGETLPAGSAILFLLASANRDDRRFPNGDSFDIHRQMRQHLTFGVGLHYCMGAALARLEGRIALEELLRRFPVWDVDWDGAELSVTSTVRGWDSLPIILK